MPTLHNSTEERALKLLGSGLGPEVVANALGISASRVSQLLSDPDFAAQVEEARFNTLQSHNERDNKYDDLEDKLLSQMKQSVPLMVRPLEIARALQIINNAKRRGSSAPEQITQQNNVVQLVMPTQIVNNFTTNINNQVVTAGAQELVTMQSGALLKRLEESKTTQKSLPHESGVKNVPSTESAASRTTDICEIL